MFRWRESIDRLKISICLISEREYRYVGLWQYAVLPNWLQFQEILVTLIRVA